MKLATSYLNNVSAWMQIHIVQQGDTNPFLIHAGVLESTVLNPRLCTVYTKYIRHFNHKNNTWGWHSYTSARTTYRLQGRHSGKFDNDATPNKTSVKYLEVHLHKKLTGKIHCATKRKEQRLRFWQVYWLMKGSNVLSLANERLLYAMVLRPLWSYGIPAWICGQIQPQNVPCSAKLYIGENNEVLQ